MKSAVIIILASVSLLFVLALPQSVAARHGQPTPTPTVTGPSPTPTPPGATPTPTPPGATPTPTPQPLIVITSGFSCTNGVCTLSPGNVGTSFSDFVTSSGGQGPTPYTWRLVAGSLPAGLSLARNFGVYSTLISGTPTQVQTTTFTLQVTDGVGDTAQRAFTLTIDPPPPLVITFPSSCCPNGTVGTAYLQNFALSGGVGPYTASIASGQLPPGLHLSLAPPISITGIPTTAGTFTFAVRVTDSTGAHADESGSITVN